MNARHKRALEKETPYLRLGLSQLGPTWNIPELATALGSTRAKASAHIRVWVYVGVVAKEPERKGGHQRFRFTIHP